MIKDIAHQLEREGGEAHLSRSCVGLSRDFLEGMEFDTRT